MKLLKLQRYNDVYDYDYNERSICIPFGFQAWAYSDMEWSDFKREEVPPSDALHWAHSVNIPKVGEIRSVLVGYPFAQKIGSEFYMVYQPALVFNNGYQSTEDINSTAIVKCRFEDIITSSEYNAWITVEILNVYLLHELTKAFFAYPIDEELESYAGFRECDTVDLIDDRWECKCWTEQGEVGEYKIIYTDESGVRHLVYMTRHFGTSKETYFGNIIKR